MKKIEKKSKNFISFICAYSVINGLFITLICGYFLLNQFFGDELVGWTTLTEIFEHSYLTYLLILAVAFGVALLFIYWDIKRKYIDKSKSITWGKAKQDLFSPILCAFVAHIFFLVEFPNELFTIPIIMDIVISILIFLNQDLKKMSASIK